MKRKHNIRGSLRAKKLLADIGLDHVNDYPLKLIASGLGATVLEEPLDNCDGTIVRGETKVLIKINSNIQTDARWRFTLAHEIGHLLLHDGLTMHKDNAFTLDWLANTMSNAKSGIEEWEANDFAAELLMPENEVIRETQDYYFSQELIADVAEIFKTSLTAAIFRMVKLNIHPVFLAYSVNGKVKYWMKADDMRVYVKNCTGLPPPEGSVMQEYVNAGYKFIYKGDERTQVIDKSTWFELYGDEEDSEYYEYCIPTMAYKTVLSVVWRD